MHGREGEGRGGGEGGGEGGREGRKGGREGRKGGGGRGRKDDAMFFNAAMILVTPQCDKYTCTCTSIHTQLQQNYGS